MSNNDVGRIGARVRAARVRLGWSRETLASAAGVSFSAVVQIESGRRGEPRIATVAALAAALDVSVDYLIGRSLSTRPLLSHSAFFYEDDDEFVKATLPFITEGLEREEAVVVVTTPAKLNLVREGLADAAKEVELVDGPAWYTTPHDTLVRLRAILRDHIAAGRSWSRVIGETSWKGRAAEQIDAWVRYEALVNLALATAPATVLCPYHRRTVPEHPLATARHTHPTVFDGAGITPSEGGDAERFMLTREALPGAGSRRRLVRP